MDKAIEYFVLVEIDKSGDESFESVSYRGFSLGYQLNDKIIRGYEAVSKTLTELMNDILITSNWSVGYIDSEFDLKRRGLEVSSLTVLEIINELAEKFGAIIDWDTVNKKINMLNPNSVGKNKGFKITDEKYLISILENQNSNEIVTRMRLYGHEGLSIRRISPTGSNYIEDYSFYMYPFERDANKNVINHSYYMTDNLCHAILDYQKLVEDHDSIFSGYLDVRTAFVQSKSERENELATLQTELKIILNQLDIENSLGVPDPVLHAQIINDRNIKETQVVNKKDEINEIQDHIDDVDKQIEELQELLKVENNFTFEQLNEWNDYIKEREYTNDSIIDEEDLLKEGQKAFEEAKQPLIEVSVDIVNLLEILECQNDWDKLEIGDIISIQHKPLGIDLKARISEIHYDFENSTIQVVIVNAQRTTDADIMTNLVNNLKTTSTEVSLRKDIWNLSEENNGAINELINNVWDATKQAVEAGYEQLVEISERGIIIRSPNDPNKYIVMQNGLIALTLDRGNTWKTAIRPDGIIGETIMGKIILGVNLAIEDESGIMKWRGSRGQIFNRSGDEVMRLGLVSDPENNESDCFGLESWNSITKVAITDCEGISISRKTIQDEWDKIFWVRSNDGTLFTKDMVAERLKIVNNIGDEILNSETGEFDIGWFDKIVADGKLTTLEKYEVWAKIDSIMKEYNYLIQHVNSFVFAGRDDNFNFNAQNPENTKNPSTTVRVSTTQLTNKYNALLDFISNYISIPPTFDENIMERTDEINRSTFSVRFKDYYDEANRVRGEINNFLFYSGLQLGTFYNNLIIDPTAGFMAIRDDYKYRARLSATDGLALEKWENGWVKKLYAAIGDDKYDDGTLIAEGLVTKSLTIEDGELGESITFDSVDGITINGANGEQIRLNAQEGIAIDVEDDPRFWVGIDGNLYAKKLIITPDNIEDLIELEDGSFISDLTVNSLRSLNSDNLQDYVYVKDNFVKLFTGQGNNNDIEKFSLELKGTGYDGYPYTVWGAGNEQGANRGYLFKDISTFTMSYDTNFGERKIALHDALRGIEITSENGRITLESDQNITFRVGSNYIEITAAGVKINGSRIDLN